CRLFFGGYPVQTFRSIPPAVRVTKEKTKPNVKAVALLCVFFTALIAAGYLRSPLSKLQSIVIEGNQHIPTGTLEEKSGLTKQMNVWKIRPHQVQETLLHQFPLVSSADVTFHFPDRVVIRIVEKQTVGLYMSQGKFYHMLIDGTLLDEVPVSYGANLPIVSSSSAGAAKLGMPVNDSGVVLLAKELAAITPDKLAAFSDIRVQSSDGQLLWVAGTLDGFQVRFDAGHLVDKLPVFEDFHKKLLDQGTKPGVISLLDKVPAYYSPYGGSPVQTGQKGAAS
ncbi:MAG: hypothetical protein JWN30_1355, partial [Bacilli bacterium]|nr:hypothetical protein [Bacilli bacterium]